MALSQPTENICSMTTQELTQNDPLSNWYPVANADDLPFRHTFHGKLLGQEIVIWRADDGNVNIWVNRCLHRGVRLSRGLNNGAELQCQYHGWRYANRTGGCTYIPAHPVDSPAQHLSCETFPAIQSHGIIWSGIAPEGVPPKLSFLDGLTPLNLRSLPAKAPADSVNEHLSKYMFHPDNQTDGEGSSSVTTKAYGNYFQITATVANSTSTLALFAQPVDEQSTIIRGVIGVPHNSQNVLTVLRYHNNLMCKLRDVIEADFELKSKISNTFAAVSNPRSTTRNIANNSGSVSFLKVRVARKWSTAKDVVGLELLPIGNQQLPTFLPGAHIDVFLPNGITRQYSLTNGPGELDKYRIGVKLEQVSSGGSKYIHETLTEGSIIEISTPRNNFPLRRDSTRTVLIAGGIGATPLLAMAQVLEKQKLNYELHYFAQSDEHLAFPEILNSLGNNCIRHLGLSVEETLAKVRESLGEHNSSENLYVCGPGPMLEATRNIAADLGWPDESIHFEYFKNSKIVSFESSFEIELARSALTLNVPAGKTVLQILRDNGIEMPSSCEQGACGTCIVKVLAGQPDHQDVYLNDSEKKRGDKMLTCISRALSNKITLDI